MTGAFDPVADGWRPMRGSAMPAGIGIPWAKRLETGWRYGFLTTPEHANPQGAVHGGMLVTFFDHGLSMLAWEAAKRQPCVTVQLNTHFLGTVEPGAFAELDGEITRRTRALVFVRGLLRVDGREVAAADGIWRVLQPT